MSSQMDHYKTLHSHNSSKPPHSNPNHSDFMTVFPFHDFESRLLFLEVKKSKKLASTAHVLFFVNLQDQVWLSPEATMLET